MKNFKLIFLVIFLFNSCTKEIAKEPYTLSFKFNTGEQINVDCLVHEKPKKYESSTAEWETKYSNFKKCILIYVEAQFYTSGVWGMSLLKTEAKYLAGMTYFQAPVDNASFAAGQNIDISGVIDMYGSYDKKGRKYTVDEGTFTFQWTNAADYGETNKALNGTWTLKRK